MCRTFHGGGGGRDDVRPKPTSEGGGVWDGAPK